MKIIRMTANPSGAWPPIQEGAFDAIPEGHALVPDSLDLAAFYAAVGFVVPTFSEVGETDEMPAHMAMTGYTVAPGGPGRMDRRPPGTEPAGGRKVRQTIRAIRRL